MTHEDEVFPLETIHSDKRRLVCPKRCPPHEGPFVYSPHQVSVATHEQRFTGVLADRHGDPLNRFSDGTVGVTERVLKDLRDFDDLPYCSRCLEPAEWEQEEFDESQPSGAEIALACGAGELDEYQPPSHWKEHPVYTVSNWKFEVTQEDTRLGYSEWVIHQQEDADDQDS